MVSNHGAMKVTPFELVFGQEVVLPVEVNLQVIRVARQNALSVEEYTGLMMDKLDETPRLMAMEEIDKEKLQTTKAYNRRVKEKPFQVGNLVWKTILPLGARDNRFEKWSPSWEGPYKVTGIMPGNS
jgi:hypothetical protein